VYADVEHGYIGPGKLYTRWGYQQIVWGESDLFRSLDIVNPLRIDQNLPVGEKFDEFRTPILALKALYDIGNIGTYISGAGLEAFYSPRTRNGTKDLLLEAGWRLQEQIRGCEDPSNPGRLIDWSLDNCDQPGRVMPMRPHWLGKRRFTHPWSLNVVGNNGRTDSVDYSCATSRCAPDVPNDRISTVVNLPKGNGHHHTRGHVHSGGARFIGSTWFNLDFSVNYLYLPFLFANTNPSQPLQTYGDGPGTAGSYREGLLRCLSASGKQMVAGNNRSNNGTLLILEGTDLFGYDAPGRRLDENGLPLPTAKQPQASRAAQTICTNGFNHNRRWSHILGFTLTYNDFDYTGAVFRFEQSYSTKEGLNKRVGSGNNFATNAGAPNFGDANDRSRRRGRIFNSGAVWRSMVGFDIIQALMNYPGMGWTKNLPGQLGVQQSFITGQWLMQYNATGRSGVTNNMCNWNFAQGMGPSLDGEFDPADPNNPLAPERKAIRGCKTKRFNHLFTIALAGLGYFRGKLEHRNAFVYEPRGKHVLLFTQMWWREFMSLPVDISWGTAWFLGSRMQNSWTLLNYFASRDIVWLEATYYIL
jgi:hypothetical protein